MSASGERSTQRDKMIEPEISTIAASPNLRFGDFEPDAPRSREPSSPGRGSQGRLISGVTAGELAVHADSRGSLSELLTTRDGPIEPIVHVYQVTAEAGSIRAWVYHRWQYDRLAFTNGRFRIALYDIRPDSPTVNMLNVFVLGRERPGLLRLPPYVIHGVQNVGSEVAMFINMPTKAYDPGEPDKCRLPAGDIRIPFNFDE
jgi:dTDP-4-dehydrorhamnose 3,5-epimerase